MASYGLKQFNYSNVVNYKNTLITNRDQMQDFFQKYNSELNKMDANWMGQSASVSKEEMNRLITQYNAFITKVNEFITVLSNTEMSFTETEKQTISTYNN